MVLLIFPIKELKLKLQKLSGNEINYKNTESDA